MNRAYRFDERALQELKKLGRQAQRDIVTFLDARIAGDADPRRFGKGLKAGLAGLWRYHVGDYRILCQLNDGKLLVLVVAVGHRRRLWVTTVFVLPCLATALAEFTIHRLTPSSIQTLEPCAIEE